MIQYTHYDSPMSPHSFFGVLHKRRKVILVLFIVIVGSMTAAAFLLPPIYRATSKVMVKYQTDNEKAYLLGINQDNRRTEYDRLASEVVILKMRSILEPVVTRLELDKPSDKKDITDAVEQTRRHEEALEKLSKKLKVEREKDTNVLSIGYESKNAALASRVVDQIITEYITQRPGLDKDDRAYEFFDKQITLIKKQISEQEVKGMKYKSQEKVISPDQQTRILFTSISDFDKELTKVRAERISKEAKLQIIREHFDKGNELTIPTLETSESLSRYEYLNELKKTLLSLELEKNSMKEKYTERHPSYIALDSDIREAKDKIRSEVREIIDAEETSIKALFAAENALAQRMNQVVNSVAKLSQQEYELGQLTIGVEDLRSVYSMLIRQREEARIASGKQEYLVQVRLLEPAMVPYTPAKPNRPLMAGIGLVLGIFVSLGMGFFLEYFDHSVNTAEDAQHCLGLPILAVISDSATPRRQRLIEVGNPNADVTASHNKRDKVEFKSPGL